MGAQALSENEVPRRSDVLGRQRTHRGNSGRPRRCGADRQRRLATPQPLSTGLVVFPKGDDCLRSPENALPIGYAIDKGDPVFLKWLTDMTAEIKDKYEAEEVRVMNMN